MKISGSVVAVILAGFSFSAFAQADAGVAVGGSVTLPSATTSVFTNPAGLPSARGVQLSLQGGSEDPVKSPRLRPLLLAGNGILGLALGGAYDRNEGGTDQGYAVYGLGLNIPVLGFALGVSGRTGMKEDRSTYLRAGIQFRPLPFVVIGATAVGLDQHREGYGAGLALALPVGLDLVVDGAVDQHGKNAEAKPGIRLSNSFAGISVSYGTGDTAQFSKDVSAGAFFRISGNSELEFEYNHGGLLPEYYAALSLGF